MYVAAESLTAAVSSALAELPVLADSPSGDSTAALGEVTWRFHVMVVGGLAIPADHGPVTWEADCRTTVNGSTLIQAHDSDVASIPTPAAAVRSRHSARRRQASSYWSLGADGVTS